jgi:nucleotide-binding universal stress UspA family protein
MWKKILVPHDFSSCADRALELAVELAKVHHAEVTLLHVSDLPDDLTADTVVEPLGEGSALVVADYATRGALRRLEKIAEPLWREGLPVRTKAVTGTSADEILSAAQKLGTDVLVVGTHGRTGISPTRDDGAAV